MASILIIEDDTSAAKSLSVLLAREGHECTCANDVGSALRALRTSGADLVMLPRIDGLALLDAIRDEGGLRRVPIVVYSARDDEKSIEMAKQMGAVDFINKRADWPEVCRRVEQALAWSVMGAGAPSQAAESTASFKVP
jgi:DNA-binding response OmpR family regulator